jgi:transposase
MVREGFRYEGKTAWTKQHLAWLQRTKLNSPLKELAKEEYLREVEQAAHRVARLTKAVEDAAANSPLQPLITALQALRGVQVVTAATVAAEIGDFHRFAKAKHFMSYLGLVPREASSGEREWRGSITKAGNSHMRRVLTEAAWHYRFGRASAAITKRRRETSEEIQAIAERADARLHHRWRQMTARKKEANKVNIAIARELAGFIWAIARTLPTPS